MVLATTATAVAAAAALSGLLCGSRSKEKAHTAGQQVGAEVLEGNAEHEPGRIEEHGELKMRLIQEQAARILELEAKVASLGGSLDKGHATAAPLRELRIPQVDAATKMLMAKLDEALADVEEKERHLGELRAQLASPGTQRGLGTAGKVEHKAKGDTAGSRSSAGQVERAQRLEAEAKLPSARTRSIPGTTPRTPSANLHDAQLQTVRPPRNAPPRRSASPEVVQAVQLTRFRRLMSAPTIAVKV